MNRTFKPQVESLEERMMMDAAGAHVLPHALVAPVAVEASINFGKIEYSYKPQKPDSALSQLGLGSANLIAFDTCAPSSTPGSANLIRFNSNMPATPVHSAIVFVGGWGSSMYQYAFEGNSAAGSASLVEDTHSADHELGHALGFRHEHTRPTAAADDVLIDGKIITAEGFDTSAAPGNDGDDVLLGGEGWDTKGGAGLDILIANTGGDRLDTTGHGTHVAGTIGAVPSGGANVLLGDGSVRFVSDGTSTSIASAFQSSVDDGERSSKPLPVLLVIANRDFYD